MIFPGRDGYPPTLSEDGAPYDTSERALALAGIGYLVLDETGRVVEASGSAAEILSIASETLMGRSLAELVPPTDRTWIEQYCRMVENRWAGPTPRVLEVPVEDGGLRAVGISGHLHANEAHQTRLMILLKTLRSESEQASHISKRTRMLSRFNELFMDLTRNRAMWSGDSDRIFSAITEAAADLLGVDRVGIWLYDEERTTIRCWDLFERVAGSHESGAELSAKEYPHYFAALEENRTITADDARIDPRTAEFRDSYLHELGITSMLDAPVCLDRHAVGVLCHEHIGAVRHWIAEDEVVAGSMADLVAMALQASDRKKTLEQIGRREKELRQQRDRIGHALESPLETLLDSFADLERIRPENLAGAGQAPLAEAAEAARALRTLVDDLLRIPELSQENDPPRA